MDTQSPISRHQNSINMEDQIRRTAEELGIGYSRIKYEQGTGCAGILFEGNDGTTYSVQDHGYLKTAHSWPADGGEPKNAYYRDDQNRYDAPARALRKLIEECGRAGGDV